jgi:hypothetical protein
MSTTYTNDSYMGPAGQRPYPQHYGSPNNHGPWFDDFGPSHPGQANFTHRDSAAFGKRTVMTAVVAAIGAGAIVGLFAFNFGSASPDPSVSTAMVPDYGGYPAAAQPEPEQTAPAPNVGAPPSNSSRGGIVNVPTPSRPGGQVNAPAPVPAPALVPQPPAQAPVPGPMPIPVPAGQDPAPKKDTDPKQDPAPKDDGPFVPPDAVGVPKLPGDVYTQPPVEAKQAPKYPIDIYTKQPEPAPAPEPAPEPAPAPAPIPLPVPVPAPDQPFPCPPFVPCPF